MKRYQKIGTGSVEDRVREIIVHQLQVEKTAVTMDASFALDLRADSLSMVLLITVFEEEFDLEIPDEDVEEIKTVGDAICYIQVAIHTADE